MNPSETVMAKSWGERMGAAPVAVPANAPLKEALVERQADDQYRVFITASESAKAGALANVPEILKSQGYTQSYADVQEGRHVLVVQNLSQAQAENLPHFLKDQGLLAKDMLGHRAAEKSLTTLESLKRDSLKWSGRLAMAGSMGVAAAGLGQGDWKRLQTGLTLMAADSVVAIYGNGKGAIDFDALFHDMHTHFEHNGVHLPEIATPEKRLNAIEQVNAFIAKNPVEINYGLGMMSGIGHIRSGFADFQKSGAGISRMTKGVLGAAGSAGVIFLPEDKERKQNIKPFSHYMSHVSDIPQGISDFVLASPIRFKGLLSSVYSTLYLTDTFEERKKMKLWANEKGGAYQGKNHAALTDELSTVTGSEAMRRQSPQAIKQAHGLREGIVELERREGIAKTTFGGTISPYLSTFTAICYLASSLLAAASSRNRDKAYETTSEYEPMYAMATRTVAMLPEADRPTALTQIASYLSSQQDVKEGEINAPQIIEEVRKRLAHIEQSPWLPQKDALRETQQNSR